MTELDKYFGSPLRKIAFQKLKVFLYNPGYFTVFVSGGRGTGKSYAIESIFKEFESLNKEERKAMSLEHITNFSSSNFGFDEQQISNVFSKHKNGIIVLNDIENFTEVQQNFLFKAMETSDGKMGLSQKVFIRVVFTSSESIDDLRSGKTPLKPLLWERISQLLVEFPSFFQENDSVMKDFRNTWDKMNFQSLNNYKELAKYPNNTKLQMFVENNAIEFKGGFRDLDKICILYFNYRIYLYGNSRKIEEIKENKIVDFVKEDFFGKLQTKEQSLNELSVFYFEENETMKVMEARFKLQLRRWAEKLYGGVGKAEKAMGVGHGVFKYYNESKLNAERKKADDKRKSIKK
jgi:hypothetical protein